MSLKIKTSKGSDEIFRISPYHQRLCRVKSDIDLVGDSLGNVFKVKFLYISAPLRVMSC